MKQFFISIIVILLIITTFSSELFSQKKVSNKKYVFEMSLGPRFPIGVTRDDITTGLGLTAGVGQRGSSRITAVP